jgi:hypothetical protein
MTTAVLQEIGTQTYRCVGVDIDRDLETYGQGLFNLDATVYRDYSPLVDGSYAFSTATSSPVYATMTGPYESGNLSNLWKITRVSYGGAKSRSKRSKRSGGKRSKSSGGKRSAKRSKRSKRSTRRQ